MLLIVLRLFLGATWRRATSRIERLTGQPRRRTEVGQHAVSQLGVRATHTRRPCRISRRLKPPRSAAGTIALSSSSTFTGSVSVGEAEAPRQPRRRGCRPAGRAGRSPRCAPRWPSCGRRPAGSRGPPARLGTSPSKRSTTPWAMPMRLRGLVLVEAGRADDLLDARPGRRRPGPRASGSGRTAPASPCSPGRRWSAPTGSWPSAARRRCGGRARTAGRARVLLGQPPRHLRGPTLRRAGTCHPGGSAAASGCRPRFHAVMADTTSDERETQGLASLPCPASRSSARWRPTTRAA